MDQLVGFTTSEQKFVRISVSHLLEVPHRPHLTISRHVISCDFSSKLVKYCPTKKFFCLTFFNCYRLSFSNLFPCSAFWQSLTLEKSMELVVGEGIYFSVYCKKGILLNFAIFWPKLSCNFNWFNIISVFLYSKLTSLMWSCSYLSLVQQLINQRNQSW